MPTVTFSEVPTEGLVLIPVIILLIVITAIRDLIWKGIALRHAAQRREKNWFIFLLIINSVGILPIIYLIRLRILKKQALSSNNS